MEAAMAACAAAIWDWGLLAEGAAEDVAVESVGGRVVTWEDVIATCPQQAVATRKSAARFILLHFSIGGRGPVLESRQLCLWVK